jgi:predicted small lipoprotein YifL
LYGAARAEHDPEKWAPVFRTDHARFRGEFVVNRNYRLTSSGWAIILLSVTALALAGCGRKGPLDLPPTASKASQPGAPDSEVERAAQPSVFSSGFGGDGPPEAPKGNKKSFILDPLLNSN